MTSRLTDDLEFVAELTSFLTAENQWPKTNWFDNALLKVYLRNGPRYIQGQKYDTITVANVEVYVQRQGTYSDLLALIESMATVVFIENVYEREHHAIYLKRGYTALQVDPLDLCMCFYKVVDQNTK